MIEETYKRIEKAARTIVIQECISIVLDYRKTEIGCDGMFSGSAHEYCDNVLRNLTQRLKALDNG